MQVVTEKPHLMAETRGTRDVSSFSGIFSSLSFANVWKNCLRHFLPDRERHPLPPRNAESATGMPYIFTPEVPISACGKGPKSSGVPFLCHGAFEGRRYYMSPVN